MRYRGKKALQIGLALFGVFHFEGRCLDEQRGKSHVELRYYVRVFRDLPQHLLFNEKFV